MSDIFSATVPCEDCDERKAALLDMHNEVIYDSWVHGSWAAMRDRTDTQGTVAQVGGEKEISLATLSAVPPGCYDGPQPGTRSLAVASPLQRGLDVRLLQLGLCLSGIEEIRADGIFGATSARLLKGWQQSKGMPATGVADPATVAKLATV